MIGEARLPKDLTAFAKRLYSPDDGSSLALVAPSRGAALDYGSDFASRWSVLNYGAEGYVGQVGTSVGLIHHPGWYLLVRSGETCSLSEAAPH